MDKTTQQQERLISETAAAAVMGVGRQLFRKLEVPHVLLAGRRMFKRADVEAFKLKQTVTYEGHSNGM